jgi:nitrite reductase/ring-hydroxylating ferredoxin subunit
LQNRKSHISKEINTYLGAGLSMPFVKAASTKDVKPGQMKEMKIEEKEICIANVAGQFFAIGNRCTHMKCRLSDGTLDGSNVTCPCHGSTFNVQTGNVINGPATRPEPSYQVKVENNQVLVNV